MRHVHNHPRAPGEWLEAREPPAHPRQHRVEGLLHLMMEQLAAMGWWATFLLALKLVSAYLAAALAIAAVVAVACKILEWIGEALS
jgi:hypothetical protein